MPERLFALFQPAYHFTLAFLAALWFGFPSRDIKVIGVTGTKGKSSTVEILNAILEEAGFKTALSNTIRFKIGAGSSENLYKMSMPGRFFIQKLIRQAVQAGCEYFIVEITSQGALLYRHRFIELDTLVFTNLSPEHIEAHGSYENYAKAKLSVAKNMARSSKPRRTIIANADDKESGRFLDCRADRTITFGIHDTEPYVLKKEGLEFFFGGQKVHSPLRGLFNLYNILAAAAAARNEGVSDKKIAEAVRKFAIIPGRLEKIEAGQNYTVIVDYAHTPDSLEKLYQTFESTRKICVLGGTGGGRDTWKRAEMGGIADAHCDQIILTNEDPYDEDPKKIVADVAKGIINKKAVIIMDRREAIRLALRSAGAGDAVLITGKGTDPFIMGPQESKIPWSDAKITEEEIREMLQSEKP
ncbi:MAG: UDP-N-acetylmuramoyl-L-alanyl-D-glutamate--2,6-diaminopimelate ligase [Candidatus Parcubacteria bacterium]|jgi:UDP-N-acetylmuramoyl-L-alanyl-D-glutamate--2,6-diaminopimelate ligase|nr:UDP-N-acetylmuramoyl-L-alanyl-D-glutamate--2,6-diaminopimelate ligase [Candidatus Parcubacteria bacterium]